LPLCRHYADIILIIYIDAAIDAISLSHYWYWYYWFTPLPLIIHYADYIIAIIDDIMIIDTHTLILITPHWLLITPLPLILLLLRYAATLRHWCYSHCHYCHYCYWHWYIFIDITYWLIRHYAITPLIFSHYAIIIDDYAITITMPLPPLLFIDAYITLLTLHLAIIGHYWRHYWYAIAASHIELFSLLTLITPLRWHYAIISLPLLRLLRHYCIIDIDTLLLLDILLHLPADYITIDEVL
jgi:hypothetical protein